MKSRDPRTEKLVRADEAIRSGPRTGPDADQGFFFNKRTDEDRVVRGPGGPLIPGCEVQSEVRIFAESTVSNFMDYVNHVYFSD